MPGKYLLQDIRVADIPVYDSSAVEEEYGKELNTWG